MRKNFLLLLLAAMFTMVSCNYNEDQVTVNTTEANQEAIVDGKVPLSRAITNANFVFKNIEGASLKNRKVKSVDVLTTSNSNSVIANTRSGLGEQEQPVAYVVNYENNEGFAILAADTKLPPVIGIGDEGNFNTQGFIDFVRNRATRTGGSELNPAQEVQYAVVNNSLLLPPTIGGPYTSNCSDTTIIFKCLPLVPTKWGQYDPYNYYAYDSNGNRALAGCVPVAGAQVLASLCYHHNWRPSTQLDDEYTIAWYTINRILFSDIVKFESGDHSSNALAVASLIRAVGEDVDATYGSTTTASTQMLTLTFSRLGLDNPFCGNEDEDCYSKITKDDIMEMIVLKNFPVISSADASNINSNIGHAFVLDGWLRLEYSVNSAELVDMGLVNSITVLDNTQHRFDLVHANFGWDGDCDGYYLHDAFNLTEDKYREYAESNEQSSGAYPYVFDLDVYYLIYDMQ